MTLLASIIVPHFRQQEDLAKCLASLERQSVSRDHYEIFVVDNASPEGVGALMRKFPKVRFLTETRRGAAFARNRGLEEARGRAIVFTDADCVAAPAWLEEGLRALEAADLVGGGVDVTVRRPAAPTAVEAFERVFAFRQRFYIERKQFAVTANLFARRAAVEAIGPFRGGLAEDVDWCHRAVALGLHLAFNDKARVGHPAREDFGALTAKLDRLTKERWGGFSAGRFRWLVLAAATALSAAPHLAAVAFSDRIRGWRARFGASAVLVRIRVWRAARMIALARD